MKTYKIMVPRITLVKEKTSFPAVKLITSRDAYDFICQFARPDNDILETAHLILINNRNITIGYVQLSVGGTTGTVMDPKIIGKYAIESLAGGVVIAHNHPSGDVSPSKLDITATQRVKSLLQAIETPLIDHIIISDDPSNGKYFSFADEGLI